MQRSQAGKEIADLDESGFKLYESRGYGYAPRGEACLGQYDW
ncbi:transposase [Suttonella ornithocola]|nr:transposase [Suttonella ornithocola]